MGTWVLSIKFMEAVLYLIPFLFIIGCVFLYLDKSGVVFNKRKLYRKKWYKYLYAAPTKEIKYQIRNNTDLDLVHDLKRYLKFRRIGYSMLAVLLFLFLLSGLMSS